MRRNERRSAPGKSSGRRFDAFDLARKRGTVSGDVAADALPRIADSLASDGGHVAFAITGTVDAAERPALDIHVEGVLVLTCQRCLQPMAWTAEQTTTVLLAHDQRQLVALDEGDEHEVLLADAPLDALELIEDELLLTIPYAPRHPQSEAASCVGAVTDETATKSATKSASPFGVLAELKPVGEPAKVKPPKR